MLSEWKTKVKAEFLNKAKENLNAAQDCFDKSFYNASVNRAYYAAFQAAIAALADKGIRSSNNDHKWIQATFSHKLIKRQKIYPNRLRSYLMEMQIFRNQADYTERPISKKVASRQLGKAKEFLETVERGLGK